MSHKSAKAESPDSSSTPDDEPNDTEVQPDRPAARPVSVPAKASCLTLIFLLLAVLITLIFVWHNEQSMRFGLGWWLGVSALIVIIPIVVYRAVTLWMFDESARYPDIVHAWNDGIAELAQHGMSLDSAPLFVIVGTGSERMRRSFMAAAAHDFLIDGVCPSGSPLYWYANTDGIFLYLNDICWANATISLYESNAAGQRKGLPGDQPHAATGARNMPRALGTLVPDLRGSGGPSPCAVPTFPRIVHCKQAPTQTRSNHQRQNANIMALVRNAKLPEGIIMAQLCRVRLAQPRPTEEQDPSRSHRRPGAHRRWEAEPSIA